MKAWWWELSWWWWDYFVCVCVCVFIGYLIFFERERRWWWWCVVHLSIIILILCVCLCVPARLTEWLWWCWWWDRNVIMFAGSEKSLWFEVVSCELMKSSWVWFDEGPVFLWEKRKRCFWETKTKKMEYSGIDESNNEKNPSHFFFFKYFTDSQFLVWHCSTKAFIQWLYQLSSFPGNSYFQSQKPSLETFSPNLLHLHRSTTSTSVLPLLYTASTQSPRKPWEATTSPNTSPFIVTNSQAPSSLHWA